MSFWTIYNLIFFFLLNQKLFYKNRKTTRCLLSKSQNSLFFLIYKINLNLSHDFCFQILLSHKDMMVIFNDFFSIVRAIIKNKNKYIIQSIKIFFYPLKKLKLLIFFCFHYELEIKINFFHKFIFFL